jgi:uncharacterized membrane protein YraQ (UPF0718 family)
MKEHPRHRGLGGWIFLAVVLVVYAVAALTRPALTWQSLEFFTRVMRQVLPALGLVFVLLYAANLLLTPQRIKRYLGTGAGGRGWAASVAGGILSMGPVYVWYTVLGDLRDKGMRTGLTAAFLYARAIKPALLPLMVHYFGLAYTGVLCLYLALFSPINGMVVERLTPPAPSSRPRGPKQI